jgi:hypothetical protein
VSGLTLVGNGVDDKIIEHRGDGTVWAKLPDGRFVEVIEKPVLGAAVIEQLTLFVADCHRTRDFWLNGEGEWTYKPRGRLGHSALALRALADEVDRLNDEEPIG